MRHLVRIGRVTATLLCSVAVLAAVALAVGSVAGYKVLPVLSGSMEPGTPVGSAVIVESVPASTVRVGDVITFENPLNREQRITHRVIEVSGSGAQRRYRTQGDANEVVDPWNLVLPGTVGRMVTDVPHLGYAMNAASRPVIRAAVVPVIALILLVALLRRIWTSDKRREEPAPRRASATAYGTPW